MRRLIVLFLAINATAGPIIITGGHPIIDRSIVRERLNEMNNQPRAIAWPAKPAPSPDMLGGLAETTIRYEPICRTNAWTMPIERTPKYQAAKAKVDQLAALLAQTEAALALPGADTNRLMVWKANQTAALGDARKALAILLARQ